MIKTIIRRTGYAFAALLTFGIVVACTNGTSPVNNGHEEPHRFIERTPAADVAACFDAIDGYLKERLHVDQGTRGYVLNINPQGRIAEATSHIIDVNGYKYQLAGACNMAPGAVTVDSLFKGGIQLF